MGQDNEPIILVIDSDTVARELLTSILLESGQRVTAVRDAEAGLAYLKSNPHVALILSQVPQPGMTAAQFFERLQRTCTESPPPVIVITRATVIGTSWVNAYGFAGVLRKPFEPATVLAEVRRCLGAPVGLRSASVPDTLPG